MKQYRKLKVGQIRQKKDEVRRTVPYLDGPGFNQYNQDDKDFSVWQPVRLIGHAILQSDLIVAEFRREVAID